VTHGIATLQDLMLRGEIRQPGMLLILLAIGVTLYVVSLFRLRRIMRRVD
jgi:hypothetical protein